jgi:hypothetical protein
MERSAGGGTVFDLCHALDGEAQALSSAWRFIPCVGSCLVATRFVRDFRPEPALVAPQAATV